MSIVGLKLPNVRGKGRTANGMSIPLVLQTHQKNQMLTFAFHFVIISLNELDFHWMKTNYLDQVLCSA